MNKRKVVRHLLIDGQELDKVQHKYLYELFMINDIDLFNKTNKKLTLKYVGYIEVIIDEVYHELYCFPKEYCINNKLITSLDINDEQQYQIIKEQFGAVIKCILKAKSKPRSQGQENDVENYTSSIFHLQQIINHHQQYGNLVEVEKEYTSSSGGKINWNKTIGKVIPKYINNNFVYDRYIIEKKNVNITFLTKLIAKVIKEGTATYNFILTEIDTGIDYSDINDYQIGHCIELLCELRNKTFKDYLHNVIDNLISYLSNQTNNAKIGSIVGTNNFEYTWEILVSYGLGEKDFKPQKSIEVGSVTNYSSNVKIRIDHLSIKNKTIVDSKYYAIVNEENKAVFDYKQLFYNYYMVYQEFMLDKCEPFTYNMLKREYKSWTNILVRPTGQIDDQSDHYQIVMKDGLELYTIYVDIKQIINSYVNNQDDNRLRNDIDFIRNQYRKQ